MKHKKMSRDARSVYVLHHVAREGKVDEDTKLLGIYSSNSEARVAIKRFLKIRGFKLYPKAFCLSVYRLNKDEWAEGFTEKRS